MTRTTLLLILLHAGTAVAIGFTLRAWIRGEDERAADRRRARGVGPEARAERYHAVMAELADLDRRRDDGAIDETTHAALRAPLLDEAVALKRRGLG